ncbi:MAG: transketolase [Proteobacteria bacterium]|nr:transketolase [Pseudomonadota bacterium]MBU1612556.1 transketolase [Pseudomonadota bacterium]
MSDLDKDQLVVDTIKGLVMDATRKANSGHPGGAMSSADFATVLFKDFLNYDPTDTTWFNRDRFILSAGHESMLLYSLLNLQGFLPMAEIEQFRQFGSLTPGHPESDLTPGVEATTGPLGQGFAMSVGFAAAEAFLREKLGEDIIDHYTYVLASDGDMQEPISMGTATLAGRWKLGKLIAFYDSNKVQIAGPTSRVDCTDYKQAYEAFCWQVIEVDGHDRAAIAEAIKSAQLETDRPTLIIGHTTMAKGTANREGDHETHGAPLPPEEIAASKKKWGLDPEAFFQMPEAAQAHFRVRQPALKAKAEAWRQALVEKTQSNADFAAMWKAVTTPRSELKLTFPDFKPGDKMATRKAWGLCLAEIMDQLPTLMGGSADLDPSNVTVAFREHTGNFAVDSFAGRNLSVGVREFPMATIMNGLALHGGIISFGATFLTFSDYCRNACRMSALQELPVLYVFTHDSFYLGEDGPTHQPIEHVSALRLIPNSLDLRPAEATETRLCLDAFLTQDKSPAFIHLTRQGLPTLDPAVYTNMTEGVKRGGYVLVDTEGEPDMVMLASGSEVSLAMDTAKLLPEYKIRIVSMPSMNLFERQDQAYKDSVLLPKVAKRVAVEAGRPELWYKYVGMDGLVHGIDHFGHSAPANLLAEKYGFTAEKLAALIKAKY